jgi:hypothetical protein
MVKVIVFDLDETLGYFSQFSLFWNALIKELQNTGIVVDQKIFSSVFSLYPEFVRPNIKRVLRLIRDQKRSQICEQVLVYTNNNGPQVWVRMLVKYFNELAEGDVFDYIIHAFVSEVSAMKTCRTSICKSYSDLVQCASLPKDAEICFIDDVYYPTMISRQVYYVNIRPYYYNLPYEELIRRFRQSPLGLQTSIDDASIKRIMDTLNGSNYLCFEKPSKEKKLDRVIGKMLLENIRTFLHGRSSHKIVSRFTQKKRKHVAFNCNTQRIRVGKNSQT